MKKFLFTAAVWGLLAGMLASSAIAQTAPTPRKKRVAVFDFDYATVHSGVAAIFGQDVDVGKGISDLLVKYLVKDGSYSVIERKAMDKILAEQNFSNSDRANPNSAAKLGKLLGVDAIIVGSITQFGNDTKKTGLGGAGGGLGGFGLGGFKHSKSKAIVGLDARIVEVGLLGIGHAEIRYVQADRIGRPGGERPGQHEAGVNLPAHDLVGFQLVGNAGEHIQVA